ncbi:hypothetical protein BZG02_09900 [Labilibaculum filiforme]|uniref:Uncharacterized protein n=1 Tax=Labilibaculum filiforme TaxID=1940526 RepID=A0A2N3HYF2_9BACT|nr:hypothetical protein [Labilibaculum filiforme]PKQ63071.1 hypothetical protein BZG02_09900 [Labilibaculum filiforme]
MYTNYSTKLISSLQPIESMISTLQATLHSIEENKGVSDDYSAYKKHSEEFKKCVQAYFQAINNFDVSEFFDQYAEIKESIAGFEALVVEFQDKDRFYSLPADGLVLKTRKFGKRFFLKTNWGLLSVRNKFRTLFKKEPIPKNYWKHKIPSQQLAELVYFVRFLEDVTPIVEDVLSFRQEIFKRLKAIDKQMETNLLGADKWVENDFQQALIELSQQIGAKKIELDINFKELKEVLDAHYTELHAKTGTIEFSVGKIQASKLNRKALRIIKRHEKLFHTFNSRAFAVFEHWRLVYEVRFSNLSVTAIFNQREAKLESSLQEVLLSSDSYFVSILEEALARIQEEKDLQDVEDNLLAKQLLAERVPNYIEKLLETDFAPHFDQLKLDCSEAFANVSSNYLLPSKKGWHNVSSLPKLRETNVLDIVSGCIEEAIDTPLLTQKEALVNGIQKSLSNTSELAGIVDYALEYFNAKDHEQGGDQLVEFTAGIERAVQKAKENKQHNIELSRDAVAQINTINSNFITEISSAISPENLDEKQTEMIRKRRIRNAKNRLISGLLFFKVILSSSYKKVLDVSKQAHQKYTAYREVLGLSEKKETIGSELSNYLSETEISIARLPLMYQRLFKVAPITNAKFRIEREQVIQQLEIAYSNWTSGKFAPTCLVGEAGSGITSMVNVFKEKFGHQYAFYRFDLETKISSEEEFIQFLQTVFADLEFNSMDELIEKVQHLKGRRIIVIENVHQLFLRKLHGFKNLTEFFRLISQTNSQIFWLSTCLLYTYKYLNYTLKMSDHFGYVVNLDSLNREQLTEIIIKRHKFSGFKLHFLPPKYFHPKRNYKRMSEVEKQNYLEADYFNRLYKFAQNNLSLALVFWMRSVVSIEDNNFYMQYKHLEYSFFNTLSTAQITTLHALVLHGGLRLEEHAAIFAWKKEESFAHLMVFTDDGILIKKNGVYLVNPLVYRQISDHLAVLNYIH